MNWNNVSLIVLGVVALFSAFLVALWISLVIWTFRDMRARTRDAFAQLLAALMVLVLGPLGVILYLILRPRETLAEKYERSLEEEALLQDIEERNICPGCKQPIEPDYVLCPICHTPLRRSCLHCGRLIHPRWTVCPYCAESQRPVPGIEGAGRVTMLDLQGEDELLAERELASPDDGEYVAALEAEAMHNWSGAVGSQQLAEGWDATDASVEEAAPDKPKGTAGGEAAGETSDDDPDWTASPGTEQSGSQGDDDGTLRRTLFKQG